MKKIIALATLSLSLTSFAQSYLVLNNGVTLTTDSAAFVYDIGHFVMPYTVSTSGGQFLVENGKFVTIDEKGYLYRKDEKAPSKLNGFGSNYLIDNKGVIYTFDSKGYFYKFSKDGVLKKANTFGGNFFTVKPDDKKVDTFLYTVNTKGNYLKVEVDGLKPELISKVGGNYFQTSNGVVYTVSSEGFVFAKSNIKVGKMNKIGGNYFIDSQNTIYTVSKDGFLFIPSLPANLDLKKIKKTAKNYMIDSEGRFFGVDSAGIIYEREVKHDLREAKITSNL